jgi:hypothetical protein
LSPYDLIEGNSLQLELYESLERLKFKFIAFRPLKCVNLIELDEHAPFWDCLLFLIPHFRLPQSFPLGYLGKDAIGGWFGDQVGVEGTLFQLIVRLGELLGNIELE